MLFIVYFRSYKYLLKKVWTGDHEKNVGFISNRNIMVMGKSKILIKSSKMDIARMKKDYTSIWNYE